jgi:hypothetical protein
MDNEAEKRLRASVDFDELRETVSKLQELSVKAYDDMISMRIPPGKRFDPYFDLWIDKRNLDRAATALNEILKPLNEQGRAYRKPDVPCTGVSEDCSCGY